MGRIAKKVEASENIKSDFLIVGTMKSGTTLLSYHLNKHPSIALPAREIFFFTYPKRFLKGAEWYSEVLKKEVNEQTDIVGEKSNNYSYFPGTAEKILSFNPECKLLWIFRNPVDRAYSNYIHNCKTGLELRSFDKAVELEEKRFKRSFLKGMLHRGKYAEQLERYLNVFPKEQMHFILFENLIFDTENELAKVFDFLDVKNSVFHFEEKVINPGKKPWTRLPVFVIRQLFGRNNFLFRWSRDFCLMGKQKKYPPMKAETRSYLQEYYKDWNTKLEKLSGLDCSVWEKN